MYDVLPGKYTYHSYSKFYETLIPDVVGIDQHKFRTLGKVRGGHIFPFMCKTACLIKSYYVLQGLELESMTRYVSPINPAVFPHLTVVLLGIGVFFMAWFFVYPLYCIDTSVVIKSYLSNALFILLR